MDDFSNLDDQCNIDYIFNAINNNQYIVNRVKKILKSIKNNTKKCSLYIGHEMFIETDQQDYKELLNSAIPILIQEEEYELCAEIRKINEKKD